MGNLYALQRSQPPVFNHIVLYLTATAPKDSPPPF